MCIFEALAADDWSTIGETRRRTEGAFSEQVGVCVQAVHEGRVEGGEGSGLIGVLLLLPSCKSGSVAITGEVSTYTLADFWTFFLRAR